MRVGSTVVVLNCLAASLSIAQGRPSSAIQSPRAAPAAVARRGSATEAFAPVADGTRRPSYFIPVLEVIGFNAALNLVDRSFLGSNYATTAPSIRRNLRRHWVVDEDPFQINQFLHPYQGSMNYGFARSAGLNYWESIGYSFGGSALWEIAGERVPPSKNDFIASGIAGTFLGEVLFRIANLLLENAEGAPGSGRRLALAAIAPPAAFNRAVGDRFDDLVSSRGAVYYRRWQLGVQGATLNEPGTSTNLKPNEAIVDLALDYGLPGKPGYSYTRPFDYFAVQATGSSANGFESILTHGLLAGTRVERGRRHRGIWGLYGSYDYMAPQVFRISSTALSLGATGQSWISSGVAWQAAVHAGAGYAAVGTLHGTGERDYHYGLAPQALIGSRFIFGDRASFDFTAREYFVSGVAAASTGGHDNIVRGDASLMMRLHRQRAIAIKYQWSRRDAFYPTLGRRRQQRATLGVSYALLGHDRFGAVDWR